MIDVGIATAAMNVDRQFQRKTRTTAAARIDPTHEMLLDALDRRLDELRQIANDADLVAGRRERGDLGESLLHRVDDLHGVRAGLPADREHHARLAIQVGRRLRLRHAVFDRRHVAQQNLMPLPLRERRSSPNSSTAPTRPRVRSVIAVAPCSTRPPGISAFCVWMRAGHVGDGEVVGAQTVGVEEDVDLARAAADHDDLADAADALQLTPQRLVGVLGDVADRRRRRNRQRHDRSGVGIELLDRRLLDRPRQQRQHAVHSIANFLRGDVAVLLEQERDDDLRDAFRRIRAELVDAADRVDGFLDLVGDLRLDLFRRGSGEPRRDDDGGKVDLREPVQPEAGKRECADDGQRERDDGRKDRTTNGD